MGQKRIAILFLIIVILFASCSNMTDGEGKEDIKDIVDNVPDQYQQNVSDKMDVDASVSVPQTEQFAILSATEQEFDRESVAKILFQEKEFAVTDYNEDVYKTSDGDELNFAMGEGAFDYQTPFGKLALNVFDYGSLNTGNRDAFQETDIEGFDKEVAIATAKNMITQLGITVQDAPEVIVLDAETMQQEQDALLADDYYQMLLDGGRIAFKDTWTAEDSCYYLVFSVPMRNIPVFQEYFTMQTIDDTIYGSAVHVLVSKQGVEVFAINYRLYEETAVTEEVEQLVTMEYAIQKADEKYSQLLNDSTYKITEVQLVYMPVVKRKDGSKYYAMTPTWTMVVEESMTGLQNDENGNWVPVNSVYRKLFLLNAVTGEEII